ncbi:putative translation-inhibition endoribonuclease [Taylorella asinigenitalis 14/45]|uniref:Putative translation-inhibition endoribonuclease n=1 Tax=Taylorella asinigenitalis 14/45 TaxID=1091495 RepID=I7JLM5_9BURK|nr:RidA family protein [Taylorella asinigenitalis]CCG19083.1 putative translation-inhibition endoribonuclease [Taylorella asinigenitalis 14/45]
MEKLTIKSSNAPEALGPYSQGVLVNSGKTLYLSGQIGLDPKSNELVSVDTSEQAHQVFQNIKAVLQEAGCGFENVVKLTIFLTDLSKFSEVNEIMKTYFKEPFPARSTVEIKSLPKNAQIEIEAIAVF